MKKKFFALALVVVLLFGTGITIFPANGGCFIIETAITRSPPGGGVGSPPPWPGRPPGF